MMDRISKTPLEEAIDPPKNFEEDLLEMVRNASTNLHINGYMPIESVDPNVKFEMKIYIAGVKHRLILVKMP